MTNEKRKSKVEKSKDPEFEWSKPKAPLKEPPEVEIEWREGRQPVEGQEATTPDISPKKRSSKKRSDAHVFMIHNKLCSFESFLARACYDFAI